MMKRCTGYTTMLKLKATLSLLEGKSILVVTGKQHYAETLCRQVGEILNTLYLSNEIQRTRDTIRFKEGIIKFQSVHYIGSPANKGFRAERLEDNSVEQELRDYPELEKEL